MIGAISDILKGFCLIFYLINIYLIFLRPDKDTPSTASLTLTPKRDTVLQVSDAEMATRYSKL